MRHNFIGTAQNGARNSDAHCRYIRNMRNSAVLRYRSSAYSDAVSARNGDITLYHGMLRRIKRAAAKRVRRPCNVGLRNADFCVAYNPVLYNKAVFSGGYANLANAFKPLGFYHRAQLRRQTAQNKINIRMLTPLCLR